MVSRNSREHDHHQEVASGGLRLSFDSRDAPERLTVTIDASSGSVSATLTFTVKRKGRNAPSGGIAFSIYDAAGELVAVGEGTNPVELFIDLPAGIYRFEVSGTLRTSYRLEVTYSAS